jgi:asparagine synthase (glutamine-hydrolysing)
MLDAIAHRGPDGYHVRTDGPIALGHCLLRTTPESRHEQQPFRSDDKGLSIVFDGRLDNREELLEAFTRERLQPAAEFDAAYVLCAYQLWGEDCASRLLGDFGLAIWDARHRHLFCARDVLGVKPFYYHAGREVFLFASEPRALLRHPAVSRRVNEGMVGEFLSVVTSLDETLLADIQRLPPACRLSVSAERCRVDKYWEIDFNREIRYKTVDQYREHLQWLIREAVRMRIRGTSKVGVMLSGGVDSSSLLGTAISLSKTTSAVAECEAYSVVDRGELEDESYYSDLVVAKQGCRAHDVPSDTPPASEYRRVARVWGDRVPSPNGRAACSLRRLAACSGVRVLLTGFWGDEWFGGTYYECADLFRNRRWKALLARVRTPSGFPTGSRLATLPKIVLWPLLTKTWRKRIKRLIGRDCTPRWVRPDFARRIALADRLYPMVTEPPFPTIAQRMIYQYPSSGSAALSTEEDDRTAAECGVENRHPFGDRRIMEFGMAIPEELRWRNGTHKYILREAMREHLPDEVGGRLTSADGGPSFLAPMREILGNDLSGLPVVERQGWIDVGPVRALWDSVVRRHAAGDSSYTADIWPLWMIAAVEVWMEEVIQGPVIEEYPCEEMLMRG